MFIILNICFCPVFSRAFFKVTFADLYTIYNIPFSPFLQVFILPIYNGLTIRLYVQSCPYSDENLFSAKFIFIQTKPRGWWEPRGFVFGKEKDIRCTRNSYLPANQNYRQNGSKPEKLEGGEHVHGKTCYVPGKEENRNKDESKHYADHFKKCRRKG